MHFLFNVFSSLQELTVRKELSSFEDGWIYKYKDRLVVGHMEMKYHKVGWGHDWLISDHSSPMIG